MSHYTCTGCLLLTSFEESATPEESREVATPEESREVFVKPESKLRSFQKDVAKSFEQRSRSLISHLELHKKKADASRIVRLPLDRFELANLHGQTHGQSYTLSR